MVLIMGIIATGGISNVWKTADEGGRIELFKYASHNLISQLSNLRISAWIQILLQEIPFGELQSA